MEAALELFGGIGLFLFGMSLMGSSLEKLAGSGMGRILEKLTTSKKKGVGAIKGWALGLGVTGIIQSSAATTIMLIGFVNAGIMTLAQAIPVVFGANVGSTVTAQILRLGDLGSGSLILQLLKPSSFAPMLVAVGAGMYIFVKKQKVKDVAGILIGLGTLFYGMTMMEEVFAPLKSNPKFQEFFTSFSNPLIGILTGLVLTAIIQSSSASVGILQALSATGSVTYGIAIPIIIGQNIGKCMTIVIGGIGANKKAKRVALSYLLFNIIGAIVIGSVVYAIYYTVGIPAFENTVNRGNIANLHLAFNLIMSVLLLPLSNKIAALTGKILRDKDEEPAENEEFRRLDPMLLSTPGIALSQCRHLMKKMGSRIVENYNLSLGLLDNYDQKVVDKINENESFIDRCETEITRYALKIDTKRLTPDNRLILSEILNSIGDFERIGDRCINIAFAAQEKKEKGVAFSAAGLLEIAAISGAVDQVINMTLDAFEHDQEKAAHRIFPLSETIGSLSEAIQSHHVERLQEGDCGVNGGVVLYDLVNSFESIGSHASNIARHVVKRVIGNEAFDDMHGEVVDPTSPEYKAMELFYREKYLEPIMTTKGASMRKQETEEKNESGDKGRVEHSGDKGHVEYSGDKSPADRSSDKSPQKRSGDADPANRLSGAASSAMKAAAESDKTSETEKRSGKRLEKEADSEKTKKKKSDSKNKDQKIREQKNKDQKGKDQKSKDKKEKNQKVTKETPKKGKKEDKNKNKKNP